jgi:hypothetical protein
VSVYESDLSRLVDELNRTKPGLKTDEKTSLDMLLALAAEQNASDIILVAGSAITLRANGSLADLVRSGRISRETALAHCYHLDELRSHLNVMQPL